MKKRAVSKTSKRPGATRAAKSGARLRVVVAEKDIRKRVRELGRQISRDYAGKTLHVVGILEDSFIFMADLVRALTVPVVCYFVRSQVRDSDSGMVAMREIMYIPRVDAAGQAPFAGKRRIAVRDHARSFMPDAAGAATRLVTRGDVA